MKIKIAITVFFIAIVIYFYQNFIINVSPSEPLGIYKIERLKPIQRGDLVAVCLTPRYQKTGLKNGYLIPGIRCHGSAPLIKTVIAVPGDTVNLKNDEVIVNDKVYPYATKSFDSQGRKLTVFPRGIYEDIKQYWLIGANSSKSWDSRYWGGVERNQVLWVLRRL